MLLKKYSDFVGEKKKSDSEFLSYNLMLILVKKIRALSDKKINSNSGVLYDFWEMTRTAKHVCFTGGFARRFFI
jgi:hypothetical protein